LFVECCEMAIDSARNEQYNVYTCIMIEVYLISEIVNKMWSQIKTEQFPPPGQFYCPPNHSLRVNKSED
jgi:hypothetical protein